MEEGGSGGGVMGRGREREWDWYRCCMARAFGQVRFLLPLRPACLHVRQTTVGVALSIVAGNSPILQEMVSRGRQSKEVESSVRRIFT